MERRGRIPVANFRTARSRSRVREPDYNEQDPETDLFTLLEDNIALKEENKELKLQIEDHKKVQAELLDDKKNLRDELVTMKKQQYDVDEQIRDLTAKFSKANNERNALDKLHKMKIEKIDSLNKELQALHNNQNQLSAVVFDSIGLKSKLLKLLPAVANSDELESIIDVDSPSTTTGELVERLVDEFQALKNSMNSVELQLYEANEKISDLMENQHHLEEENETLRSENINLTKVAKLLTENMKESVETSKKMESALIKLKQRNDELTAKARDLTDGRAVASPSPTTLKANQEFEQIKERVETQNRDHGERIVEVKLLMDAAIQKSTNDELKTLQLKLQILEDELRKAIARAELAEHRLNIYRKREDEEENGKIINIQPPPPPPPPPPMPANLLYTPFVSPSIAQPQQHEGYMQETFSDIIAGHNLHRGEKIIDTVKQQVQPEAATGLDALVREFKSGRVTLRRNRRKTRTNEALQEMFQVLEISQRQNRDSKICIDMHL